MVRVDAPVTHGRPRRNTRLAWRRLTPAFAHHWAEHHHRRRQQNRKEPITVSDESSTPNRVRVIREGVASYLPDIDPDETSEWIGSSTASSTPLAPACALVPDAPPP